MVCNERGRSRASQKYTKFGFQGWASSWITPTTQLVVCIFAVKFVLAKKWGGNDGVMYFFISGFDLCVSTWNLMDLSLEQVRIADLLDSGPVFLPFLGRRSRTIIAPK